MKKDNENEKEEARRKGEEERELGREDCMFNSEFKSTSNNPNLVLVITDPGFLRPA